MLKYSIAILLSIVASQASAGLGRAPLAPATGVASTSVRPQAAAANATANTYTQHQLSLASGTVVTEYANNGSIVFAVSWAGPVLPDLTALLGDYFPTFKAQTARRRAAGLRGGPVQVDADGLTVVSAGRMGHFSGYAYAASLVPSGFDVATVLKDAP